MIEEWVDQCRNGQTRAFAQIVQALHPRVLGFLYRMTQNRELAEDLGQEVFLRAYHQLARYDSKKAAFSTWLLTLARNLCLDHWRKQQPTRAMLEEAASQADSTAEPDQMALEHELEHTISQAVQSLETQFREVFILREYENLPLEEVAVITDCPLGTVKSRLYRARLLLQEKLKPVMEC